MIGFKIACQIFACRVHSLIYILAYIKTTVQSEIFLGGLNGSLREDFGKKKRGNGKGKE